MKKLKFITSILLLLILQSGFSQVQPNKTWTDYLTHEGVKIEYKYAPCNTANINNQVLALFKFTNTTSNKVQLVWNEERWVSNVCSNCNQVNSLENTMTIILEPNQTIEGDCTTKEYKERYIFSNFIKLCPGMSKKHLTDFKFRNLTKEIL